MIIVLRELLALSNTKEAQEDTGKTSPASLIDCESPGIFCKWLEKEMATHSSVIAWRIPGTGEPGGLPFLGSHRVGHN